MRRWLRRIGALVTLVLLITLWAWSDEILPPETISGALVRVRDGDTIDLDGATIRIAGIDAPEYHQTCKDAAGVDWPCGRTARAQLEAWATAGRVECALMAQDQYRRRIGRCSTPTVPDLGEAMVRAGLAVSPAISGDATYADAEEEARDARRGLWQGEFDLPSQWRAQHLLAHPAGPGA
jgi:endonuclease YncB( thermonuclease family)